MRRSFQSASVCFALGLAGVATMGQSVGPVTLAQLKDNSRPLLIFAPSPEDPRMQIQVRTLAEHAAAAHERDLVPIAVPYHNPGSTPAQLSPDDAEEARRRFHVAPQDFTVILLGKDGGAKLRADKPLSIEKLSTTIDAMPMRQDEMRGRGSH